MSTLSSLLTGTTVDPTNVAPALKFAMEARNKARNEKLGNLLLQATEHVDSFISAGVRALREARKAESNAKEQLNKLTLAQKYFEETGNPLPFYAATGACSIHTRNFVRELGLTESELTDEDKSVPKDWKPSAAE